MISLYQVRGCPSASTRFRGCPSASMFRSHSGIPVLVELAYSDEGEVAAVKTYPGMIDGLLWDGRVQAR